MTIREALKIVGADKVQRGMRVFGMKDEDRVYASHCFVGLMIDGEPGDFCAMLNTGSKQHREACRILGNRFEDMSTREDLRTEAEAFLLEESNK